MDLIAIGTVRTAWGLGGWVKLNSLSGEWDHFKVLKSVVLKTSGSGRSREYGVEGFRIHQGGGQFKFSGVDSPEAAKTLSGLEIMVPRESGAFREADEWYVTELVGLKMVDPQGTILGEVISVISSADDILEVATPEGAKFMVPFRSEFVGEPDIKKGVLVLTALWVME